MNNQMDKKNMYKFAILEKLIMAHTANKMVILQTDQENTVTGMFTPYNIKIALNWFHNVQPKILPQYSITDFQH